MGKKELGLLVLLVVICAVTAIINPQFISPNNLKNLANLVGIYGLFSIGIGMVIITSGIDLSIGSMLAFLGVILVDMLVVWQWPWPVAFIAIIAAGMFLGYLHGWLVTRMSMQPFIVTLCGLLIYRGLARFVAEDNTKGFVDTANFDTLINFTSGTLGGVPKTFIILAVVGVIMWVLLHRSIYGRHLFAVGKNEEAAHFSGINSKAIITSAYIISGALAALAGVLLAFYTNSVSPSTHGSFYELYGIAAAVLGGCSLRGGEGSIVGIILGTILLQVLQNLVNLLGIPSSLNFAVMGVVILIGVMVDMLLKKRQAKKLVA